MLCIATGAAAQSDSELRRENQRLQAEVHDCKLELEAAIKSIAELEDRLTAAPDGATASPLPAEEVSIDESVADASPRALLNALKESYAQQMKDHELGDPAGDMTQRRHRTAYLRSVEKWTSRVNREFKSPIVWHIRIVGNPERQHGSYGLMVVAVDPKTDVQLGDRFPLIMSKSTAHHLSQLDRRGPLDVLVVRGVLTPRVRVHPYRMELGPFDNPRFIGPFAEYGMSVDASSVTRPENEAKP